MAKNSKQNTPGSTAQGSNIPLKLPADLKTLVEQTSEDVHLSEQETMRQALRRGLPILRQVMTQHLSLASN